MTIVKTENMTPMIQLNVANSLPNGFTPTPSKDELMQNLSNAHPVVINRSRRMFSKTETFTANCITSQCGFESKGTDLQEVENQCRAHALADSLTLVKMWELR